MYSKEFVELALKELSCSQKELAEHLEVSPTQITKWKKGERMSDEMEDKFREITNIGDRSPRLVLFTGSVEDADKWDELIHNLANDAQDESESDFNTITLQDEYGDLSEDTFRILKNMGVEIPKTFPKELEFDYDEADDNDYQKIYENPFTRLICAIYDSCTYVYGFYAAYIEELFEDEELDLYMTAAENIEPCLLSLAASKVDVDEKFAPKIRKFRMDINKDFEEWLNIVKEKAFRAGKPLRAELLNLINHSNELLCDEAEAESLGFNSTQLHPDIYMNELLVGVRAANKALEHIMKKLEIDGDFKLDESDFTLHQT
ncbi:helix-turn-helix domain-containing protein [Xylocopilactobacillus apis]|uniref:HTH cro/C1-type domain-containing protein n=1 Tax=Xylocopilactobacillus apis TaxID=2932183 RepID=A0AAU9CP92_9LACO|nr:hypothetical protein [Xylocopilactobacillus apis]BDR55777.1 hypothetical protein KIMC2_03390 [Xylocopilactobacillus apis]